MSITTESAVSRITEAAEHVMLTLLIGAGVSRPAPSFLPTASDCMKGLYTAIREDLPARLAAHLDNQYLDLLIREPFEQLMSRLWQGVEEELLDFLAPLRGGLPNQSHYFIAQLLRSGFASQVITTNFDNLIERALEDDLVRTTVVWDPVRDNTGHRRGPLLYKAHGSFVDPKGNDASRSILTTVESIARSTFGHRLSALSGLFDDQVILVLGYSGSDRVDVIPALRTSAPRFIFWLDHGDSPVHIAALGESQRHLADVLSDRGVLLRGDSQLFCNEVAQRLGLRTPSKLVSESAKWEPALSPHILKGHGAFLAGFLFLAMGLSEQRIAEECFSYFIENADGSVSDLKKARAFVGLGQTQEFWDQFASAKQSYRRALRIYEREGVKRGVGMTLNDLGACFASMHDYDAAIIYHRHALSVAEELADAEIENMAWHGLGVVNEYQENREASEVFYSNAIRAARKAGTLTRLALGLGNRQVNRSLWNPSKLISEGGLEDEIELLELYWILGIDEPKKRGRHQGLCAGIVKLIHREGARTFISGHPVFRRIGMTNQILDVLAMMG